MPSRFIAPERFASRADCYRYCYRSRERVRERLVFKPFPKRALNRLS
jgi:hypothetical protein